MAWLKYFGIFCCMSLLPLVIWNCIRRKTTSGFLTKDQTQTLRGIAILLVLLSHSMQKFSPEITYFTPFGGIGVSVFLMLSGYGLNESFRKTGLRGCRTYWLKRFSTAFFPYLFIQILFVWLWEPFQPGKMALDLLCIKTVHPFGWYMSFLLGCYILFFLTTYIKKLLCIRTYAFLAAGIAVFVFMKNLYSEQAFSFLIGILLSQKKERIANCKLLPIGLGLLFTGAVALAVKQINAVESFNPYLLKALQLVIKECSALGLIYTVCVIGRIIDFGYYQFLGTISMELYLLHYVPLDFAKPNFMGFIVFLCYSLLISWVFAAFFRKTKKDLFSV